jgi:bacterioferritin
MNLEEVCEILNEIMESELAGVVRYTHSSMMVTGPYRLPIVAFLKEQAAESLVHAQQAGEMIAGLDGHPSQRIAKIEETHKHSIENILEESLEHEIFALNLYKKLLEAVENKSIFVEEYARGMIAEEEQHSLELKRMLKDFG